jgi:hypothetical protein
MSLCMYAYILACKHGHVDGCTAVHIRTQELAHKTKKTTKKSMQNLLKNHLKYSNDTHYTQREVTL